MKQLKEHTQSQGLIFNPNSKSFNNSPQQNEAMEEQLEENTIAAASTIRSIAKKRPKPVRGYPDEEFTEDNYEGPSRTEMTYGFDDYRLADSLLSFQKGLALNGYREGEPPRMKGRFAPALGEQIFNEKTKDVLYSVLSTTSLLLLTFAWYRAAEYIFVEMNGKLFGENSIFAKNPIIIAVLTTLIVMVIHDGLKKKHREHYLQRYV